MATSLVEVDAREKDSTGNVLQFRPRILQTPDQQQTIVLFSSPRICLSPLKTEIAANFGRPLGTHTWTRALNVFVALIGLLLAWPICLLIAVAVKLTGKGPVLYTQTRIGLDRRGDSAPKDVDSRVRDLGGRPFTMYKFRTMVDTAEVDSKEVWATPSDKRVTPLGRFLRVSRLDELPQLWNVLAGNMNIVGPRPERPQIFAELRTVIPHYHLRQRVMPGITGWAQINQPYDTCVEDVRRKIELDLEYVRTRSVGRDISIMARTVPVMMLGKLGW
jgi:lipopolysaccharide/colanic/teichoic acid biosynthesis glycosyltransferase